MRVSRAYARGITWCKKQGRHLRGEVVPGWGRAAPWGTGHEIRVRLAFKVMTVLSAIALIGLSATPAKAQPVPRAGTMPTLVKEGPGEVLAGHDVDYTYRIVNTEDGAEDLSGVTVTDSLGIPNDCPTTVAAGAEETCHATLPADDVAAAEQDGEVQDHATLTTAEFTEGIDSDTVYTTIEPVTTPAMPTLVKEGPGEVTAGNDVDYTYRIVNTEDGAEDLSGVTVTDSLGIPNDCPTTVAAGAEETCHATLPADDVAAAEQDGEVQDHATLTTAEFTEGIDSDTVYTTIEPVTTPTPGQPEVAKSGDDSFSAGQALNYQYTITNPSTADGGQDLTGVRVADSLGMDADCPASTLDAGGSMTCKASYTPDTADAAAGEVTDTATLHANELPTTGVASEPWPAAYIAYPPTVLKQGPPEFSRAGQKLPFTYTITNPVGGEQLSNITIKDSLGMPVTCTPDEVAPGGETTCTGEYTTTDADVANKGITDTASMTATTTLGPAPVIARAGTVTVRASSNPVSTTFEQEELPPSMAPTVAKKGPKYFKRAGQTLTYTYTITNPHDGVDLTGIALQDNKAGKVTCAQDTLAPGATEKCTASYTTTRHDVRARVIANVAVFTANGGEVKEVSNPWAALLRKRPCHCHRPLRVPVTG